MTIRDSDDARAGPQTHHFLPAAVGVLAAVVLFASLKYAAVAVMPIVASCLLALMMWPTRTKIANRTSRLFAALLCMSLFVIVALALAGWGWYATRQATDLYDKSREQYVEQLGTTVEWLGDMGVPASMLRLNGDAEGDEDDADDAEEEEDPAGEGDEADSAESRTESRDDAGGGGEDGGGDGDPIGSEGMLIVEVDPDDPDDPWNASGKGGTKLVGTPITEPVPGGGEWTGRHHQVRRASQPMPLLSDEARIGITRFVAGGLQTVGGIVAALLLTTFLTFLVLLEGDKWDGWLTRRFSKGTAQSVRALVLLWSNQTRSYFVGKTISSVVSGSATGLWLWSMGVPLPIVWGVLTALLNYIPNIGAFISGVPPTLLAFLELGVTEGIIVGGGLIVIETAVGNLLDPFLQGDLLKLTPFVVLASLIFWGWLWGIPGAIFAPVLTAILYTGVRDLWLLSLPDDPETGLREQVHKVPGGIDA